MTPERWQHIRNYLIQLLSVRLKTLLPSSIMPLTVTNPCAPPTKLIGSTSGEEARIQLPAETHSDIYVISAEGGSPLRITTGDSRVAVEGRRGVSSA